MVSVESKVLMMGLVVGTVGIVISEMAVIVVEVAGVRAIEAVMVKLEMVVCTALALTGTVQVGLLLAVWTMFELLIAAATICETVKRIVLNCSVLTKVELLKGVAEASGVVEGAVVCIESVGYVLWIVGAGKIHCAASKRAAIGHSSEG